MAIVKHKPALGRFINKETSTLKHTRTSQLNLSLTQQSLHLEFNFFLIFG